MGECWITDDPWEPFVPLAALFVVVDIVAIAVPWGGQKIAVDFVGRVIGRFLRSSGDWWQFCLSADQVDPDGCGWNFVG